MICAADAVSAAEMDDAEEQVRLQVLPFQVGVDLYRLVVQRSEVALHVLDPDDGAWMSHAIGTWRDGLLTLGGGVTHRSATGSLIPCDLAPAVILAARTAIADCPCPRGEDVGDPRRDPCDARLDSLTRARVARAAATMGISMAEYAKQRRLGQRWCTKCQRWRPEGEFRKGRSYCDKALQHSAFNARLRVRP